MTDADNMLMQLQAELDAEAHVDDDLDDERDDGVWAFHLLGGREFEGPFATYDESGRPMLNIYGSKQGKTKGGQLRWVPDASLSEFVPCDATQRDVLDRFGPGRYQLRLLDARGRVLCPGSVSVGDLRRRAASAPNPPAASTDERVTWLQQQLVLVRQQAADDVKRARVESAEAVKRTHEEYKSRIVRLNDELDAFRADKRKLREALDDAEKRALDLAEKVRQLEFDKLKLEMQAGSGGKSVDPIDAMEAFEAQRQRYEAAAQRVGLAQPPTPRRTVSDAMHSKVNEVMKIGQKAAQVGLLAAMHNGN